MTSLTATLHQRIGNWTRRRHGEDVSPVELGNRRIYILPTRLGVMFAVAVVAMGIGGMNYDNNLALMLAFLLASVGFVAMHHTHRNLAGLRIHALSNEPVFAGQLAQLGIGIENPSAQKRLALQASTMLDKAEHVSMTLSAPAQAHTSLMLPLAAPRRGWFQVARVSVATRYPFGLFRGWCVLHLPIKVLVYPRPADTTDAPAPLGFDERSPHQHQRGDDEFDGLRPFQPGDSPRRISWKAYAKQDELLVRQYAGASVSTCLLDWDALPGLDTETRLAILCRWVIDMHAHGIAYGLKLPGFNAAPSLTEPHRAQCLGALAQFRSGV